jgi:Ca2+-binding EF-hand superfamily protein
MQLPPYPLIDNKDIDYTGYGYSNKFNSKFKIDPLQIHSLFGIAKNDTDVDSLKIESAHLQVQLIETLEILDRVNNHDEYLNENLTKLYDKLENVVLMQNEIFERYVNDKKNFETQITNATKKNSELMEELHDIKRKDKALEEALRILETRDTNLIEKRSIEKMREIAVLEFNHMKLTRKYDCLFEEENKIKKYLNELENSSIEKDAHLENTVIKLKEWKHMLQFYLKFLLKKLKNSVDKKEFDKVLEENNYLREKQHEMVMRDIDITKKISIIDNYKMKLKELERNFYNSEEMRMDIDIELNYLKKRLQELDPEFGLQEKLFRKFIKCLNSLEISFADIKRVFDPDNNGNIDKYEFMNAIKSLRLDFNQIEMEMLIKSMNFIDDSNRIDTFYFIRKLERAGIEDENQEEQILGNFIESIKKSGMSLKNVFELFDSSGEGMIGKDEFKFALNQLNLNISDETISKILWIITGDQLIEQINYNQFCEIFDSRTKYLTMKNKKNNQIKNTLKIDWKTNLFASIVDSLKRNGMTFKQAFDLLDIRKSGDITYEEFGAFIRKINTNFTLEEIESLFNVLDINKSGRISSDEFTRGLEDCEFKIGLFKKMMENQEFSSNNNINTNNYDNNSNVNNSNNNNISKISNLINENTNNFKVPNSVSKIVGNKYEHKSQILEEKEKYYQYKIQQMRTRIDELEKNNKEVSKQLEDYATKHISISEKYFNIIEESSKMKSIYDLSITKEELNRIEMENDQMQREVTLLRIGLNTFKDLYRSSCKQNKSLNLNNAKNLDELETYKKAMKELQAESNPQALIGKLYYSLLISRWRESASIKKYDDLINDLAHIKEENFKMQGNNCNLMKEVTELQTIAHEKIIENIRLEDILQSHLKPIVTIEQLDELKSLVRDISSEKTNLTEKYFDIRRENLRLINENEEMKNKIEYSNALIARVKISTPDEFSVRLIEMTEEISKLKLSESLLNRENTFFKEGEIYLRRLIEHNDRNIKNLEASIVDWEKKYRQSEQSWKNKDEERQKKFFEQLRKMSLDELRFGNKGNKNLANISLSNFTYGNGNTKISGKNYMIK